MVPRWLRAPIIRTGPSERMGDEVGDGRSAPFRRSTRVRLPGIIAPAAVTPHGRNEPNSHPRRHQASSKGRPVPHRDGPRQERPAGEPLRPGRGQGRPGGPGPRRLPHRERAGPSGDGSRLRHARHGHRPRRARLSPRAGGRRGPQARLRPRRRGGPERHPLPHHGQTRHERPGQDAVPGRQARPFQDGALPVHPRGRPAGRG